MRGSLERLADMLEAIEKIEKYAARGRNVFESEELVQTWVSLVTKFNLVIHVLQALLDDFTLMKQSFSCRHYQVELGNEKKATD